MLCERTILYEYHTVCNTGNIKDTCSIKEPRIYSLQYMLCERTILYVYHTVCNTGNIKEPCLYVAYDICSKFMFALNSPNKYKFLPMFQITILP